jgi:hypothetical protein
MCITVCECHGIQRRDIQAQVVENNRECDQY